MINSVTITNHLNESILIDLRDPVPSGFLIQYIDGLGPPKANIEVTEMSLMDGSFYNSARAQTRNIVFGITFVTPWRSIVLEPTPPPPDPQIEGGELTGENTSGITIEDIRQKSYKYFPLKKRIKMVFDTDNRTSEVYGYVESNTPNIFSANEGTIISIVCPFSYLLGEEINEIAFGSRIPLFEFPFSNPYGSATLEFSEIDNLFTRNIYYNGDVDIGVIATIHAIGDAENVTIYKIEPLPSEDIKIDTDRLVALTGEGIHAGDDIIISTVKGDKYAHLFRDGETINILNCLEKYPDWFQLTKGDNIFTYEAETGGLNLQVKLHYQLAYEGI